MIRPSKKTLKEFLYLGIFFVVAISIWLYFAKREYQKTVPKSETVAGHFESMPEPEEIRVFEKNWKEYLAIVGPRRGMALPSSCNPVYVFDKDGKLIAWTSDHGDDTHFSEQWGGFFNGEKVDRETAMQWSRQGMK
jgi:hypothetical protein